MAINFFLICMPDEVLVRGFRDIKGLRSATEDEKFAREFGTTPLYCHCASVCNDIVTTDLDIGLSTREDISEKGFKCLLIALRFLFVYPKDDGVLASHFGTCKRLVDEGDHL